MRAAAILCVLVLAGCVTPPPPLTPATLDAEPAAERPDRFLGNLRQALADHADGCMAGLHFTAQAVSRGVAADWARFARTLD